MSDDGQRDNDDASRAREKRARLARVFGEVLPESTGDDRPDGGDGRSADWFERERPPHHL